VTRQLSTGKYFICTDGTADGRQLVVISPDGKILKLDVDLFDDVEEHGINSLIVNQMITEKQLMKYSEVAGNN
jgi:hypothetical protein